MFCRKCGANNREGDRFCKQCGAALGAPLPLPESRPAQDVPPDTPENKIAADSTSPSFPATSVSPTPSASPHFPVSSVSPSASTAPSSATYQTSHTCQATSSPSAPSASAASAARVVQADLPDGVKGWCWGGFLLNWIWAIGNRTWWGLLALIPYVNIVVAIWLGLKGRELAWRNKPWRDVDHFNRVQRLWSLWGAGLCGTTLVVTLLAVGVYVYQERQSSFNSQSDLSASSRTAANTQDDYEPEEDPAIRQSQTPQEPTAAQRPDSKVIVEEDSGVFDEGHRNRPDSLSTVAGVIDHRTLPNGDSVLVLNGKPLFDLNDEDAKWYSLVHKFSLSDGRDAVLAMTSGGMGTSCDTLFFFLLVDKTAVTPSKQFGSCYPEAHYGRQGDKIRVWVPKIGGRDEYVFDQGVLYENGQVMK